MAVSNSTGRKTRASKAAQPSVAVFVPDAERIEMAKELANKAYSLGRALENMQRGAFDDPHEADGDSWYAVVSQELGARVRTISEAASCCLTDPGYELGDAWVALHG